VAALVVVLEDPLKAALDLDSEVFLRIPVLDLMAHMVVQGLELEVQSNLVQLDQDLVHLQTMQDQDLVALHKTLDQDLLHLQTVQDQDLEDLQTVQDQDLEDLPILDQLDLVHLVVLVQDLVRQQTM